MSEWHFYHPRLDGVRGIGNHDMYGLYDTDTQIIYVFGKDLSYREIVGALSHEFVHHLIFLLHLGTAEDITVAYDEISELVETE